MCCTLKLASIRPVRCALTLLRVNEEMKVAAAKYMEEEARNKADKEEKMTKYRDSAGDAAARVIQQLYYVFSVSLLLNQGFSFSCTFNLGSS